MGSELIFRRHDDIAVAVLDRPERANALNAAMLRSLHHFLAADLGDAGAVVLTGSGTVFCAGADLDELRHGDELQTWSWRVFDLLQDLPVPVVCSLNGPAIAGGVELMLSSDLRVGARQCDIRPRGLQWGAVTCTRLARHVPLGVATASIWLERTISAEEAGRLGLLTEVLDSPDLALVSALDLAAQLARIPRPALLRSRALLRSNADSWQRMIEFQADESRRGWEDGLATLAALRPDTGGRQQGAGGGGRKGMD